jgi:glutamate racemase
MKNTLPIGVFDSGIGGLTVLNALISHLPQETFLYLGDTARLPYGTKSQQTVTQYAQQAAQFLHQQGIKMLVVACNTASAMAIRSLQEQFSDIPVIGVIESGAQAACIHSKTGHIVVAATEGTITNQAYQHAIHRLAPNATVFGQACSLFVALAEEGWLEDDVTAAVTQRYLGPYFNPQAPLADCLLLGCTHFPVLLSTLRRVLGPDIAIVDSADTTAHTVAQQLDHLDLRNPSLLKGSAHYFATDAKERFLRVANYFLSEKINPNMLHLVDIGTSSQP